MPECPWLFTCSVVSAAPYAGSASLKQAFTQDLTLYRHPNKILDEKVPAAPHPLLTYCNACALMTWLWTQKYTFKVQPYPSGLTHPEHHMVKCEVDLATYASFLSGKQPVQLHMPQQNPGAAEVKLNLTLSFRMQQVQLLAAPQGS